MTILQLNPAIPLETPLGPGHAILVIDYSQEHNLIWTVMIDATGEIWSFPNPKVRAQSNITMGREKSSMIKSMSQFPVSAICNT